MSQSTLFLLDTNMASYVLTNRSAAARRQLSEVEPYARIAVSAITQGEILFGLERKPEAVRLRAAVDRFLAGIEVLPWDRSVGPVYGRLRTRLSDGGITLSSLDLLIASHAVSLGATLVTHDGAFRHAEPLLRVVDWATDLA